MYYLGNGTRKVAAKRYSQAEDHYLYPLNKRTRILFLSQEQMSPSKTPPTNINVNEIYKTQTYLGTVT